MDTAPSPRRAGEKPVCRAISNPHSGGHFATLRIPARETRRIELARKTVLVCDQCDREVDEGKGATMRLSFSDARRGAKEADLCDSCATGMPGRATARRGRKPKSVAA
jgi:hypothetical protein